MNRLSKVALLGAGRMGGALIRGLIKSEALDPSQIIVSDTDKNRLEELKEKYQVALASSNAEAAGQADVIIVAVKPAVVSSVVEEIRDGVGEGATLISVAAGVGTKSIERLLGTKTPVVRAMPNAAAQFRASATVLSAGTYAGEKDLERAKEIFSAVGVTFLAEESLMNIVTALSGSGPAYFFLFVSALTEAGVEKGLSKELAFSLAHETMFGASRMLKMSRRETKDLIDMIASPGGTTEAALKVLETRGFTDTVKEAVKAALRRAEELEG